MRAVRVGGVLVSLLAACSRGVEDPAPATIAEQVLEADRGFAREAASAGFIEAAGRMFADSVIMPVPGRGFAQGRVDALSALQDNPLNRGARADWRPVRVGTSADGSQAFTFGYFRLLAADSVVNMKYMTYWVRTPQGWRAIAFKRGRGGPAPDTTMMAPSLPHAASAAGDHPDERTIAEHRRSLAAAEQAFSEEAQRVGLGNAFVANGRADAVNMGLGAHYVVGAARIGQGMGLDSTPSPVSWASDYKTIVASSGDLGITFGTIRPNNGQGPSFPFFTIWRREPGGMWKYIAE